MNTNPDETKTAAWLDGALQGEELAAFEAWLHDQPDQADYFMKREESVRWHKLMSGAIPASEEPSYPDFFNSRVMHAIVESSPETVVETRKSGFSWWNLLMPTAACAGMVFTFWLGTRSQPAPLEVDVTGAPKAIPVEPLLYTPESGVVAECFSSTGAEATVIVLSGVDAIPDETDFSETVSSSSGGEIDATAGMENENTGS